LLARTRHHGLIRALYALTAQDDEMKAALRERRDRYARRLAEWLRELADGGIIGLSEPETAGAVLFAMLDGIGREAILSGEPVSETQANVAVDLVERAVLGAL
jgi:AcrR family transcriptional regulator